MAHEYRLSVDWRDDPGTVDYRSYTRDHVVSADGKPSLDGSADRSFRGSAGRWNPQLHRALRRIPGDGRADDVNAPVRGPARYSGW